MKYYHKAETKPIIFHLKNKYYQMIKSGEKTTEYREYKPYWISRIRNHTKVIFCYGYKRGNECNLKADIKQVRVIDFIELPKYARIEFYSSNYNKFFAIDFKLKSCKKV